MNDYNMILKNEEKAVFELRSLYSKYGYSQYKMSKFEEYDLYVRNKDFLISDSVITFTDTNGKLMALKPDVTLSIIKNGTDDNAIEKLYYNENVYRVSKGTRSFKEIMQVGLECIGNIDECCIAEVVLLAAKSLLSISSDCVLDISHLGIVSSMVESLCLPDCDKAEVLRALAEKNFHEIAAICNKNCVDGEKIEALKRLTSVYGAPKKVLSELKNLCGGESKEYKELALLCDMLENDGCGDIIRIDFSVINDMRYYNGIVFKGFIEGIPTGILSGGQYDKLMKKLGRKSGAIGFAVYLDLLERLSEQKDGSDFEALLLYGDSDDKAAVFAQAAALRKEYKSVMLQKEVPQKLSFSKIFKYTDKGVKPIENA